MRLLIAVCILLVHYCTSFPGVKRPLELEAANEYSNINTPNANGLTPLMKACSENDFEEAQILIDKGAALDQEFDKSGLSKGNTALFFAAKSGSHEIVAFLLSKGANINHVNNFAENALLQFSTAKVAEILLTAGINVNSGRFSPVITTLLINYNGEHFEKLKILQLLIKFGAKVDIIYNNVHILSSILYATSKEEVDILISAGADINTVGPDKESLLSKLIERMHSDNKDEITETALHILNNYPQVDLEINNGITPFFHCLFAESKFPNTCFGDAHGKDIGHALVAKVAKAGFVPADFPQNLLFAVEQNLFIAAKSLWLAGADKGSYEDKDSPLSSATGLIKELFLDNDPQSFGSVGEFDLTNNPNKLNSRGQTAIFVAAKFNYFDYLEKEIEPAIEHQKSNQMVTFDLDIPYEIEGVKVTPLMIALDGKNESVVEWLIKWGANCKSAECIEKAVKIVSDPLDTATDNNWPLSVFELLFESNLIPIDYISPNGESLLMMAAHFSQGAKYELNPLIKHYFKNVEHPVEVNTKTEQSLLAIVGDEKYGKISVLKDHLRKTLPIVSEDRCGFCLEDWKNGPAYGLPYWCAKRGHVYHYACADKWKTCPLCSAQRKEPDDRMM